jgi:DNA-binding transcriptional ArsR family regulator
MAEDKSARPQPPLTIEYLPALELLVALDSAGPRPVKPELSRESGGVNPWRVRVEAAASPFELADLDLLFTPVSTVIFLFHAVIGEGNHEAAELIAFFASMSEQAFLERFKRFLEIDDSERDWIDIDKIEQALINDRARETVPFRAEAEQLAALLACGDTFRRKIVEVLTWFNARVFASDSDSLRRRVENWISGNRPHFEKDTKNALDRLTNDGYDSFLADSDAIRLYPVSDSANSDTCFMLPGEAYGVFSIKFAERVLPSGPETLAFEQLTEQAIEALSDPKRIALLRLLRKRPHFGREAAEALGISASTASYHIEKLVAARLVRLELSSGRRFYYAVNRRGFRDLLGHLEAEFIGEDTGAAVTE